MLCPTATSFAKPGLDPSASNALTELSSMLMEYASQLALNATLLTNLQETALLVFQDTTFLKETV